MDSKPWWASKTIWTNVLVGITAISTAFGFDLGLDPEAQASIVGGILAVANVFLRLITSKSITSGKEKP